MIMPKRYNPDITAPAFQVRILFPEATGKEVYELITRPLENVIHEIPGIDEIYSQSIHGGESRVSVFFEVGENPDVSKIRLIQKINSNLQLKPEGVTNVAIETLDPDNLPIMTLAIRSKQLDPIELRKRAFLIKDELKKIAGTSIINVVGGQRRDFQVILDPARLKEYEVALDDIKINLAEKSLFRSLGHIKTRNQHTPIETSGTIRNVDELSNLIISSNVEQQLKIKDIAKVQIGRLETDSYVNFHTKDETISDAVFISIAKKKGGNITKIARNIRTAVTALQQQSPLLHNVTMQVIRDEGRVAYEELRRLTINLLQAITIVLIILFFFLNIRAAIVVAISIPLTLLTVFGIGNLVGFTINRITLFALILSLGLLVDSATVIVENIVRNKAEHPDMSKPAVISMSVAEVGMGLFLATITTVLAFIPMRFVTGMMGPYMGPLPFFVSTALLVALLFSYTLNPWLAYIFCSPTGTKGKSRPSLVERFANMIRGVYRRLLTALLDSKTKRRLLIGASIVLFCTILTFPALKLLRFRMLPKADREQIYVYLNLPDGAGVEKSNEVSSSLAELLLKNGNVLSVQSFVGQVPILDFNGLFRGASARQLPNHVTLRINLTHPSDRNLSSEELALQFRENLGPIISGVPDTHFQVIEDPPGPPVRSTFMIKIKTNDPKLLEKIAQEVATSVQLIDGIEDIDTSLIDPHKKYYLRVNLDQAAISQMNTQLIAEMLQTLYSGVQIGIYHSDSNVEQEYITLKFPREYRTKITELDHIYLNNKLGIPIPLSRFVSIDEQPSRPHILTDNRETVAYIMAEMGARSVTYAAIDFLRWLNNDRLDSGQLHKVGLIKSQFNAPDGTPIKIELDGEWKMTLEVFRDLGLAMIIAIGLIYIVLVAQFRSYRIPLLILMTIPLAFIGVFPGFAFLFWVNRIYFSATSMIGVIALSGIVVNNAIILLEYIINLMNTQGDYKASIIDACEVRMRPILLTSLTTILGSLTIAGDPVWSGLAWSIVFGLSLSAILTLIIFPTLLYHFVGPQEFQRDDSCKI